LTLYQMTSQKENLGCLFSNNTLSLHGLRNFLNLANRKR
jgi:hypothetical protein